ncbi:MAG: T9SS type A sorting domain-containing protein [Bacteroidia bacterium]|nr:T9SS type A sorting domain-containing protein [Bacteroidia bacterium]
MKQLYTTLLLFLCLFSSKAQTFQTFHDFSAATIFEDTISMSQFAGKKLMVVNTASYCGYTPQFADLQELDSTYESYNFEVIGFPCNDFGNQDPHGDSSIWEFCSATYGVTFQMMSKVHTVVGDTAPIYKWLQRADLNGVSDASINWNFNKFLIDEQGHWVAHYPSSTQPFDQAIVDWITTPSTVGISTTSNTLVRLLQNPVSDQIQFKLPPSFSGTCHYNLLNLQGQSVLNGQFSSDANSSFQVLVNHLPGGIYSLQIQNATLAQNLKIAIQ